jgi:hypothetical protein
MIVLDFTARGYQRHPKISGDLISQSKSTFLKSILALSVFLSISVSLGNGPGQVPFLIVTTLCMPFVMAIIAIQNSFSSAINPFNWWLFLRAINWDRHIFNYLFCSSLFLSSAYLVFESASAGLTIPLVAIATPVLLALFRAIGVLIRANADAWGLPVRFSAEIEQQQLSENTRGDGSDITGAWHRLVAADRVSQAWQDYQGYVKTDFETMERIWPVISKWSNPALALLTGQVYIEHLVKLQQYPKAWEILVHCIQSYQHEFKLLEARTTLVLKDRAETSQQRKIAAELLRHFAKGFPNNPSAPEATLNAAELMLGDSEGSVEAKRLLQQIRIKYPETAKQQRYEILARMAGLG